MTTALTTTLLLALLGADPQPAASAQPRVGVMDFAVGGGASADLAAAASSLATHELERLGVFQVFSSETIRVVLGVDRQRQLLGCEDCSAESLSDISNFQYVVTGKVTRAGSGKDAPYTLMMSLLGVGSPQPLSSVQATAKGEAALLAEVAPSCTKLMGKLLAGRQGQLVVHSSEVGADVKIDDTQVGTAPLDGPRSLAAGPHLVSVEKDGYQAIRREVRIAPDTLSEESFRLVPSPDTIAAYEARATRMRILAWISTGLAVAGGGLFVGGQVAAANLYGSPNVKGTFEYHRSALLAGIEVEGDVNHRAEAQALKSQIQTWQTLSWVGAGVAVAGALGAAVLFVLGDPPGKYDAYTSNTGVALQLVPGPAGAALVGSF
ncbi:MAG: PEGA domain-containing protein [Myxococcales bacterium]|nr:PEGA domain-containing protein [Myxococcales bacterium]